jgi:sortase A
MFTPFKKTIFVILLTVLPLCGVWQIGQGAYIHAKALLAQFLLETAWSETIRVKKEVKPWPWADTWPVCRLTVPGLGINRIVLAGASGSSLAFGPGHLFGSALPGNKGNAVIAGHRDTHFRFLQELKHGDEVLIQSKNGVIHRFTVSEISVVTQDAYRYLDQTGLNVLTLITCYPFNAIQPGGPLRYVVIARQQAADNQTMI